MAVGKSLCPTQENVRTSLRGAPPRFTNRCLFRRTCCFPRRATTDWSHTRRVSNRDTPRLRSEQFSSVAVGSAVSGLRCLDTLWVRPMGGVHRCSRLDRPARWFGATARLRRTHSWPVSGGCCQIPAQCMARSGLLRMRQDHNVMAVAPCFQACRRSMAVHGGPMSFCA